MKLIGTHRRVSMGYVDFLGETVVVQFQLL